MSAALPKQAGVRSELEAHGFCLVPDVVPRGKLARISAAYDRAFAAATAPDLRTSSCGGGRRLTDLVTRGPEFDDLYLLDPVLSACPGWIGPEFKLSSFGGRTVLAGAAAQRLHVDVRPEEDAWPLVAFIVMLDDFCRDNGATRFVPGSHHMETTVRGHDGNHRPDDGGGVLACAGAGSVIVFLGAVWHGYSANRSAGSRRSIQGAYIPRAAKAAVDWAARMNPETMNRLSPAARHLLALD